MVTITNLFFFLAFDLLSQKYTSSSTQNEVCVLCESYECLQ